MKIISLWYSGSRVVAAGGDDLPVYPDDAQIELYGCFVYDHIVTGDARMRPMLIDSVGYVVSWKNEEDHKQAWSILGENKEAENGVVEQEV